MQSYTWARGLIVCIIAGSFLSGSLQKAFAYSGSEYLPQPPELPAFKHFEAALLQDAQTGQVLFAHNSQKIWPQASLTKMMLGLIVFEDIERGRVNPGHYQPACESHKRTNHFSADWPSLSTGRAAPSRPRHLCKRRCCCHCRARLWLCQSMCAADERTRPAVRDEADALPHGQWHADQNRPGAG